MMIDELNLEATIVKIYDDNVSKDPTYVMKNIDLVVKEFIDKYMVSM